MFYKWLLVFHVFVPYSSSSLQTQGCQSLWCRQDGNRAYRMQCRSQSARGVLQVSLPKKLLPELNDLSRWKICYFDSCFSRWTFNNSAEAKTVSSRFIRTNGSTSLLTFTPTRTLEYGTLMCWSRNSVNEQRDPCIFHIIAAGEIFT